MEGSVRSDAARVELPEWASVAIEALDLEEISREIVEGSMSSAFFDHVDDDELEEVLSAGVRENTAGLQAFLSGRATLTEIAPVRPVALAALQAQLEISQSAIQRAYRVGARVVLKAWIGTVRRAVEEQAVRPLEALDAVDVVVAAFFDYQDHVLQEVAAAHAAEQERLRLSKVQLRRQVLRSHLQGETVLSEHDLAEALQYPVGEAHIAVILTGATEASARNVAKVLRAESSASSELVHVLGLSKSALWLSKPSGWPSRSVRSMVTWLSAAEFRASVSAPRNGVEGLRQSLEEAQGVEAVRAAWGRHAPRLMLFSDVKLEVLALADPVVARRFVEEELGNLAHDDKLAAQLRETLLLWFDAGSHASAAARLNLHEHTVRNRLRRAEELLGRRLTVRRTELQVALRLHRVVTPAAGQAAEE